MVKTEIIRGNDPFRKIKMSLPASFGTQNAYFAPVMAVESSLSPQDSSSST